MCIHWNSAYIEILFWCSIQFSNVGFLICWRLTKNFASIHFLFSNCIHAFNCSNPVVYSSAEAVSRPSLLAVCLHVTYFLPDPRLPPSCPLASNKLYCLLTEADILEQLAEGCYMMMEWLGVAAVTSIMMASPMPFYTSTRRPYVTALWKRDWTGPIKSFYFLFIPCGRLSWLPVSFLLDVKYTLSYRIQPMPHGWWKSTVS